MVFSIALLLIVVLIGWIMGNRRGKPHAEQSWYLQLASSPEDALAQWFFLLAVGFFGVTVYAVSRDLGDPVGWQTIVLTSSVTGFIIAYRYRIASTLLAGLLGIGAWWVAQASEWIPGISFGTLPIVSGVVFLSVLYVAIGFIHDRYPAWKRFGVVYLVPGILGITGFLLFFSTKAGLAQFSKMTSGVPSRDILPIAVSLTVFAIAAAGTVICARILRALRATELLYLLSMVALFAGLLYLGPQQLFLSTGRYASYYENNPLLAAGVVWAVVFNTAAFAAQVGLIVSGYLRREEWLVNMGTAFLFLLIVIKYFDWFFTFLDKSVFFIGAGLLLFLLGGFMEKGRRIMIVSIKEKPAV